jgi:hypothetical protein
MHRQAGVIGCKDLSGTAYVRNSAIPGDLMDIPRRNDILVTDNCPPDPSEARVRGTFLIDKRAAQL